MNKVKKALRVVRDMFTTPRSQNEIETFLSQSVDLYDLENRIKELQRKGVL